VNSYRKGGKMEKAVDIKTLSQIFGMSKNSIYEACRTKGSPAYKTGTGKTSHWVCFPNDMKVFLQKEAEKFKG
jgi:predicted HicB family RNase H-like nuclease